MVNISIIVKDGRVEEVFSDNENVIVDIIDLDTDVPEELEEQEACYEEVKKSMKRI